MATTAASLRGWWGVVLAAVLAVPASAAPLGPRYRDGELLVRFADGAAARGRATLRAGVARRFAGVPDLALVTLPPGVGVEEALAAYRRDPAVVYAEPNYTVRAAVVPNDPEFPNQWNMSTIDAPGAWDVTTGSADVVVAVPDSGVEYTHPDLAPNVFRNEAECDGDGVDDDSNGYVDDCFGIDPTTPDSDPIDDDGHGTHVAGIIGAVGNDGIGVAGINWQVRILACKMLNAAGSGTIAEALECLDYITAMKTRGVNVVAMNASWATNGFSQALLDSIEAVQQAGILVVAAAANAATDVASCPVYPAGFEMPGLLAVAATDLTDELSDYSNFGEGTVHLGAPGGGLAIQTLVRSTWLNGGYANRTGTSMAAPHVTGVAALLRAQDPLRDWKAIQNLLMAGGDPNASLGTTTISGRRLNARGALECVDSEVVAGLHPHGRHFVTTEGAPYSMSLSALHIRCDAPAGDVAVVRQPGNQTIALHDDGAAPDRVAGDGVYGAGWSATLNRTSTLTWPDGDVATVHVWPLLANMLSNPAPELEDSFARALAMDGSNVFVGAPGDGAAGKAFCHFGSVYFFDRDTRALVRTLVSPIQPTSTGPAVIAGQFGASIAVDAGRLLVGAPFGGSSCLECQHGQTFLFDAATGDLLQIFESGDRTLFDVGRSVAIAGNNVVVGAPRTIGVPYDGVALLFDPATGALRTTLLAPTLADSALFGYRVAATPTRAAVSSANKVHVFDADPMSPGFGQLIITYDGNSYASGGGFGAAIAFVGQYLVIGAPEAWDPVNRTNGAVFVFDGATLVRTWINPLSVDDDPALISQFGASLAPFGSRVVIGAQEAPPADERRGLAYVYEIDGSAPAETFTAIPPLAGSGFGAVVTALDDTIVVAAPAAFEGAGFGAAFAFSPMLGFPPTPERTLIAAKSFSLRDDTTDLRRRAVRFRATTRDQPPANRVVPPAAGSGGDPTLHGGVLTVYNAAGLTLDLVALPLAASGPGAGAGWTRVGTTSSPRYVYTSASANGPVARLVVKPDGIVLRGGKSGWGYTLDEAAQGQVALRLQLGDAPPWCAVIPANAARQDRPEVFIGRRNAPVPVACPPLP